MKFVVFLFIFFVSASFGIIFNSEADSYAIINNNKENTEEVEQDICTLNSVIYENERTTNNNNQISIRQDKGRDDAKPVKISSISAGVGRDISAELIKAEIIKQAKIYDLSPDMMLWVADCESKFNPSVRGKIDPRDRGLWQINSYWHSEISDECAFDYICSTEWSAWYMAKGRGYEWVCWKLYYNY